MIQSFERGLGEGDNVRGAMVGRKPLSPATTTRSPWLRQSAG